MWCWCWHTLRARTRAAGFALDSRSCNVSTPSTCEYSELLNLTVSTICDLSVRLQKLETALGELRAQFRESAQVEMEQEATTSGREAGRYFIHVGVTVVREPGRL